MEFVLIAISYISLFLTIFWLQVIYTKSDKLNKSKYLPHVSVVIPAYNEEETLGATLSSVLSLNYPKDKLEIIVVNDGSTDRTKEIVGKFKEARLISQKKSGKAAALNKGLEICSGELFVCLDADSYVERNALKNIVNYFSNDKMGAVICAIKVHKPRKFVEKLQWFEYIISAFARKLMARVDVLFMTPGAFSVYRADVIKKLGGFALNNLTEDFEMALRLHKNHYKVKIDTDSISYTTAPDTVDKLFKQRVRWYRGFIDNTIQYRNLFFNKKYGMLGTFQLPISVLTTFLALAAIFILGFRFFKKAYLFLADIVGMGLDYFKLYEFPSLKTVLGLDSMLWYPVIIGSLLILFIFYKAHRNVKESLKYKFTFVIYFLYYGLLHAGSFLTALFKESFKAKKKW
ncbi:MAG: glycosyltransferase [Nanoarchaeota archaeon]